MSRKPETLELRGCALTLVSEPNEPEIYEIAWRGLVLGRIGREERADERWWFSATGDSREPTPRNRSIKQALRRLIRNVLRNLAKESGV